MTTIDEIRDNFEILDEWDDRYRYVIELGRTLEPMPEAEHSAANKVNGCVSQVWLQKLVERDGGAPILKYRGDSDAHIVRGLVAIVLALYSGRTPQQILATDAIAVFDEFGFPRSPDAAALQRPALDGRAHQDRRERGAGGSHLKILMVGSAA
ncbi:cysteine desulfuration protein SufE [Bradyrhizobium diazoefficiens]